MASVKAGAARGGEALRVSLGFAHCWKGLPGLERETKPRRTSLLYLFFSIMSLVWWHKTPQIPTALLRRSRALSGPGPAPETVAAARCARNLWRRNADSRCSGRAGRRYCVDPGGKMAAAVAGPRACGAVAGEEADSGNGRLFSKREREGVWVFLCSDGLRRLSPAHGGGPFRPPPWAGESLRSLSEPAGGPEPRLPPLLRLREPLPGGVEAAGCWWGSLRWLSRNSGPWARSLPAGPGIPALSLWVFLWFGFFFGWTFFFIF